MPTSRPSYLILGGGGAIGGAVAERLAAGGAHVVLAGRTKGPLEEAAARIGGTALVLDARDFGAVADAVKRTAELGTFRGGANCVGSIELRPASGTSRELFDEVLATNLTTAFALVRAAGPVLARGEGGSIVLLSSAAARVGLPNHEAIAAAKAGVEGLMRSAAAGLARRGVRVNAVAPGLVDTPLAARITSNERSLETSRAMHPLGRIGTPGEVAGIVAWLLGEEAGWVTGEVIAADGGMSNLRNG